MMKDSQATIYITNNCGISAFREIKKHWPHIPVIALTANVMASDIKQYKSEGFHNYLAKPIEVSKLYSYLTRYINT